MPKYRFTLYVYGQNTHTERTVNCLRRMLDEEAKGKYVLTICDVLKEPQTAEKHKILATPALVLTDPPPTRMIIGDLFDVTRVLRSLEGLFEENGGEKGSSTI